MPRNAFTADPSRRNRLLQAIPPEDWARVEPKLEPVFLTLGRVVYEAGVPISDVYFPTSAIVSLLHVLLDGSSAEIAVVGK